MFTISQYAIIGLASMIYLGGAAFLLTGRSFLRDCVGLGTSQEEAVRPGMVEDAPYFYPVLEEDGFGNVGSRSFSPVEGRRARAVQDVPAIGRRAAERRTKKKKLVLLANPICLN